MLRAAQRDTSVVPFPSRASSPRPVGAETLLGPSDMAPLTHLPSFTWSEEEEAPTCSADKRFQGSLATVVQEMRCGHPGSIRGCCVCSHGARSQTAGAAAVASAAEKTLDLGLADGGSGLLWGYPGLRAAPGVPTTGLWNLERGRSKITLHVCLAPHLHVSTSDSPLSILPKPLTPTLSLHLQDAGLGASTKLLT